MKKMKILLLGLFVVLITGCSCNYDVTINDDMSVEEKAVISVASETGTEEKIQELFESNGILSSNYTIEDNGEKTKISYNKKYKNIESYLSESVLYNELFSTKKLKDTSYEFAIEAEAILKNDYNSNMTNITNSFDIDNIEITLNTNLKNKNNSQIKDGNSYKWTINSTTNRLLINLNLYSNSKSYNYSPIVLAIIVLIVLAVVIYFYIRFKRKNSI